MFFCKNRDKLQWEIDLVDYVLNSNWFANKRLNPQAPSATRMVTTSEDKPLTPVPHRRPQTLPQLPCKQEIRRSPAPLNQTALAHL